MSKRNGFTLVELMVVIVIIGVLAAVAVPRLMAAADRARASEGPQQLGAISRMQQAYRVESETFTAADNWWNLVGFNAQPTSRFFTFTMTGANATAFTAEADIIAATMPNYTGGKLRLIGSTTVDDVRSVAAPGTPRSLAELLPSFK